ncbi:MAG: hypothetical protein IPK16_26520 [Anaerolineales bacterium]|nr:hypothetical protein [Anaerolineales bacterium]
MRKLLPVLILFAMLVSSVSPAIAVDASSRVAPEYTSTWTIYPVGPDRPQDQDPPAPNPDGTAAGIFLPLLAGGGQDERIVVPEEPTPAPQPPVSPEAPITPLPTQGKGHRVTPVERAAAAANNKARGMLPGVAGLQNKPGEVSANMNTNPGAIPHYFGPFANYANSPMPKGSIASIAVDWGGADYTAPVVTIADVYGTGSGATAVATVVDGVITVAIDVTNRALTTRRPSW